MRVACRLRGKPTLSVAANMVHVQWTLCIPSIVVSCDPTIIRDQLDCLGSEKA